MKMGEQIARARKNLHLTQEQLAEKMNVARQTVSKWENDLLLPETSKLPLLAELLELSAADLLGIKRKGTVTVTASEKGYEIDWTQMYPILLRYKEEMDCKPYEEQFIRMIGEVEKTYGYSAEDAMLALKDLFAQSYFKYIGK